jgi:hypothetical protein
LWEQSELCKRCGASSSRYKQPISELRDEARRVAANIANELLAGQSHIPLAGRAILHEADDG